MFYRIFGRSGYGKTSYIFDRLSECCIQKRKAFLVVPEQSALIAEKQVISLLSGASNLYIEVINFKRLCNRVFRETGGLTSVHLDSGAKKLLMLEALEEISPSLRQYNYCADKSDFAAKALSSINELKTQKISPSDLEKCADELKKLEEGKDTACKLYDISLIAEAYETKLSGVPGVCKDIYEKLCEKLRESNFFEGCDVFFDSFYGFTAQEYEIISLIAEGADNTYVTFGCEKDSEDEVFGRSRNAAKRCALIAEKCGCELCDISLDTPRRHIRGSALYHFENSFCDGILTDSFEKSVTEKNLETVLCSDIYSEAKCACSIVQKLVSQGSNYRDIAICAKNTSDYIGVLDAVFERADIPLGINLPYPLSQSALYELVTSALEAASTFSKESILRYVKTGLTGLDEEEADTFETYVNTWDIRPSLFRKDEDWRMNPEGYTDSSPDEYTLKIVNLARSKVFMCLDALSKNLKEAQNVKDFCTCIYHLLCDIAKAGEKESFDDGMEGKSLELLYECLDSFVNVSGENRINLSRYLSLLKNCCSDYDTGRLPEKADEVHFSSVELMRPGNIRHLILLGANSGIFPSRPSDGSLLSRRDRELLKQTGLQLSEDEKELVFDELFLAYRAITSPSECCSILYSASTPGGEKLFPSIIVTTANKISSSESRLFKSEQIESNFCGNEILFGELFVLPDGKIKNTLMQYFLSLDDYRERLEAMLKKQSSPDRLDRKTTDKLYGNSITTTYSRLEKFNGCPFAHFCKYTLGLKQESKAHLGSSETGNVIHKVLERLVPMLCTKNKSGNYPDEKDTKKLIDELLKEYLGEISAMNESDIPKRFVYLYNRLSKILYAMACNIIGELKVSSFTPVDFELDIGPGSDINPIPIDLGDGKKLYISGQIDRVDLYSKEGKNYIRVTDYKTGKKLFNLEDIKRGFNLQMLLYLASICRDGKNRYGGEIVPAGVLYSNAVSNTKNALLEEGIHELSKENAKPVSSGLLLNDSEILFAMDPTENSLYIPIGRKKGEATKKDALASLEELGSLLDFACLAASKLAGEIRSGLISISPYDGTFEGVDVDSCKYCEMKPVCLNEKKKRSGVINEIKDFFPLGAANQS